MIRQLLWILAISIMPFSAIAASGFGQVDCRLPSDQGEGSLYGAWDRLPVTLVFDSEFYRANGGRDARALKRAVQTWNRWAKQKGKVAFVIAKDGQGMEIPDIADCTQASYTAAVPNAVGVWKIERTGKRANARPSCGGAGKLLNGTQGQTDWMMEGKKIVGASVLMNFDDFNQPGDHSIDVESEFLHELGHVLGLLHSCNKSDSNSQDATTAPECSVAPKEYLEAVMSPYLGYDVKRRQLGQNDFDRINCLY